VSCQCFRAPRAYETHWENGGMEIVERRLTCGTITTTRIFLVGDALVDVASVLVHVKVQYAG
jgi:hypothetical protein